MKFRIGDKVRFDDSLENWENEKQKGIGYIVDLQNHQTKQNYLVHSEDIKDGHNGKIPNLQENNDNWWFTEEALTLIEEEIDIEPDYRKLLMENEIKNFKIKVSSSYIEVYKNKLMSNLYQKEIIDFLDYMESLGYVEKELVLYFESKGEDK